MSIASLGISHVLAERGFYARSLGRSDSASGVSVTEIDEIIVGGDWTRAEARLLGWRWDA